MDLLNELPDWAVTTLTATAIIFTVGLLFYPVFQRARRYIKNVQTCGYLPPPPTKRGLFALKLLSRLLIFIQVGRVKIKGMENLAKLDGEAYLVAPNHPHFADVAVLPIVMEGRPARYMAARGVFTFGGGLGALMFGPMGAFAVDLTKGKGGPAKEAAISVITGGQRLVMFPEGWAYLDGVMGEFKKGAVRIAREASESLSRETYLLPVFLRYGKYPGSWIRKIPPPAEYFFFMLLLPVFRRGVTVVIGEPIPTSSLPEDDLEATELLKQQVIALDPKDKR
ncbi:MAG: 1-acyl-sn-glycerol-3-phosphate acyltransferase [Candidatus Obscuribacterales bacterium]|nr:1-acyl-sn-glycerol-3-phosphate acyltransferase [Candidatus Obscuribacterales bacterium]